MLYFLGYQLYSYNLSDIFHERIRWKCHKFEVIISIEKFLVPSCGLQVLMLVLSILHCPIVKWTPWYSTRTHEFDHNFHLI